VPAEEDRGAGKGLTGIPAEYNTLDLNFHSYASIFRLRGFACFAMPIPVSYFISCLAARETAHQVRRRRAR
jgi:hypothetical protein